MVEEVEANDDDLAVVLAIATKMSGPKGVRWDDLMEECKPISGLIVEDALTKLMDQGKVYEPTLGVIKVD